MELSWVSFLYQMVLTKECTSGVFADISSENTLWKDAKLPNYIAFLKLQSTSGNPELFVIERTTLFKNRPIFSNWVLVTRWVNWHCSWAWGCKGLNHQEGRTNKNHLNYQRSLHLLKPAHAFWAWEPTLDLPWKKKQPSGKAGPSSFFAVTHRDYLC